MPRVPAIDWGDASPEVRAIFEAIQELTGRVPNSYRTLAHSPAVLRLVPPWMVALHREGVGAKLDMRVKELAILKTSMMNACAY